MARAIMFIVHCIFKMNLNIGIFDKLLRLRLLDCNDGLCNGISNGNLFKLLKCSVFILYLNQLPDATLLLPAWDRLIFSY